MSKDAGLAKVFWEWNKLLYQANSNKYVWTGIQLNQNYQIIVKLEAQFLTY